MEEIKNKVLEAKDLDELSYIEEEEEMKFRDKFYNDLLKDEKIKKHLIKILGAVDETEIDNLLMINNAPPLDYFEEEDWFIKIIFWCIYMI